MKTPRNAIRGGNEFHDGENKTIAQFSSFILALLTRNKAQDEPFVLCLQACN